MRAEKKAIKVCDVRREEGHGWDSGEYYGKAYNRGSKKGEEKREKKKLSSTGERSFKKKFTFS